MGKLNKLADKQIKAASPKDTRYMLSDGGGLALVMEPRGTKWWRLAYRFEGKQQRLSLGVYGNPDGVTLAEARDKAVDVRRMVKAGTNPSGLAVKRAAKAETSADSEASDDEEGRTFEDAANGWRALINKKPRAAGTKARDDLLIGYLVDAFGRKPANEVRKSDLVAVLDQLEDAGSYSIRARLQQCATNIMGYAEGKAWKGIENNPFAGFKAGNAYTAPDNAPRPAIVEPEEFGKLLRDIEGDTTARIARIALQLLALTWVRPGTVCAAEWSEFDLDKAMWTIPFAKLKQRTFRAGIKELNGKPHHVPLARQTVLLLRELHKRTGNERFIFGGDKPIWTSTLETALNRMDYAGVHCPHGFRSSASTMLNQCKRTIDGEEVPMFSAEAIEFQLEHVGKGVAAIYNRDQRLPERVRLMQHWADLVDKMRNPEGGKRRGDNVVPMRVA